MRTTFARRVRESMLSIVAIAGLVGFDVASGFDAVGVDWELAVADGAQANLETDGESVLRVLIDATPKGESSDVRLQSKGVLVPADTDGVIRFRGRAQWRRPIDFGLSRDGNSSASAGLKEEAVLGAEWSDIRVPFRTTGVNGQARLYFDLGSDLAGVEIADVVLRVGDDEVALAGGPASEVVVVASAPQEPAPAPSPTAETAPKWVLNRHEGVQANARVVAGEGSDPSRLLVDVADGGTQKWHVQLSIPAPAVAAGKSYALTVRVRSTASRSFWMAVGQNGPPWGLVGPYRSYSSTVDWKDYTYEFTAKSDEGNARVQIDLGSQNGAIEVASVQWRQDATAEELLSLAPTNAQPAAGSQPTTASEKPASSPWSLVVSENASAKLQTTGEGALSIVIDKAGAEPWDVQVNRGGLSFREGDACELRLAMRATKSRSVMVAAAQMGPSWANLGLYQKVDLTTEWKTVTLPFRAKSSAEQARVHLDVGSMDGNIEIGDASIRIGDRDVVLQGGKAPSNAVSNEAPVAAMEHEWEFSNGGLNARLSIVSESPWQVRVDTSAGGGSPGRATVIRRIAGNGAKLQVRSSKPAKINVRLKRGDNVIESKSIDVKPDWQVVAFGVNAGADRIEVESGPTEGTVEIGEVR